MLQGWILALAYLLAGVIACLLIVTIPFGIASFRLAGFVLWPFGGPRARTRRGGRLRDRQPALVLVAAGGWRWCHIVAGAASASR